jgi:hypothetical protein
MSEEGDPVGAWDETCGGGETEAVADGGMASGGAGQGAGEFGEDAGGIRAVEGEAEGRREKGALRFLFLCVYVIATPAILIFIGLLKSSVDRLALV